MNGEFLRDIQSIAETMDDYQKAARKTAIYPTPVVYPALGLAGETGEVCEKIKKRIRDADGDFNDPEFKKNIQKELGDVLWYIANLSADLDIKLSAIAETNLVKLYDRADRGKIGGSGDNR